MATKKKGTDWNEEMVVILEPGTRNSVGNKPDEPGHRQVRGRTLFLINEQNYRRQAAMKDRLKNIKSKNPKTYKERLKGLFGGGEEPKKT
jgi:hypothetical protein